MDTTLQKRRRKAKPSLGPYNEGGYKWAVYYRGEDGKRTRRKFYQKNEAESFLADKLVEVENLGTKMAAALDDEVKRDAFSAVEALKPFGKSIVDALNHYRAHLEATAKSALVSDLVVQFELAKEAEEKSDRYLSDLTVRLRPFVTRFGTRYASEVTPKDLQEWLAEMQVGNVTRNHYRRISSAFFAWCWRMGYCPENPVLKVTRAKAKPGVISIYSPAEMKTLLRAAATWQPDKIHPEGPQGRNCCQFEHETKDVLANIVFCGFGGLRQSEFERLTWEQVKIDRGLIDLSASITKTAARRLVKIKPVLAAWLRHLEPPTSGPIVRTNFPNRRAAFRRELKIAWKHNALRHSFASYLMEETQHPGEVSLQLGHRDAGVVFAHYRELVTADDTKAFWGLAPAKVLRRLPAPIPFAPVALAS